MFEASVFTLYPDMFPGTLGGALAGRALADGVWALSTHNIRDSASDRHRSVDDTPAGGGAGMVLRADVLAASLDANLAPDDARPKLLMSPRGVLLSQAMVRQLAQGPGVVIVCGRFEGVDERVIEGRGLMEVSIGDYVLSGGEVAAQRVPAVTRLQMVAVLVDGHPPLAVRALHADALVEHRPPDVAKDRAASQRRFQRQSLPLEDVAV